MATAAQTVTAPIGSVKRMTMMATPRTRQISTLAARALLAAAVCFSVSTTSGVAEAQEIQLTGPLAGAEAVRHLRLHREGRLDIALQTSFTLLDEYRRTIMPGLRVNYHFEDWLGVGIFGGYGVQFNAALADELQEKAVNDRDCTNNPESTACRLTEVNLCRNGDDCLSKNQLGRVQWLVAPQITVVPFRGKISLLSKLFIDTDISIFLGAAIIGVQEREDCELGTCPKKFNLRGRVTGAPTFGLGFNMYPLDYMGFGAEFRATPFAWNTSGFDQAGDGEDGAFPDLAVNSDDRAVHMNPMLTVYASVQLPTLMKVSD
jgi:hypothetical protein